MNEANGFDILYETNGTMFNDTNHEIHYEGSPNLISFYDFLVKGVLLGFVSILGIFGNIITMIILSRPQMRSSINCILIGLARCDTVLLISAILVFSLPAIHNYTGYLFTYYYKVYPLMAPTIYPIGLIAQTGSVYLTLTVTLERYVAVCHPLKARSLCTYGRARVYVILIIIFAILYNVPRFLEVDRIKENLSIPNTTIYVLAASDLRSNPYYVTIYVNWTYLFIMYFIPFTCLAIFNIAIYRQVRKANAERQRLSRLQKKEIGLATMLMCVVIVFFMCNILPLVNNILEAFYGILQDELIATSNLLVVINSSVNIIIYVIFGEKFKRIFLKLFCHLEQQNMQATRATVCCGGASGGRDSPDQTHDDSYVSNGNGRAYSARNLGSCRHHRSMSNNFGPDSRTRIKNNTENNSVKIQLLPLNNTISSRSLHPPPSVYYPANNSNGNGNILEDNNCNYNNLCP